MSKLINQLAQKLNISTSYSYFSGDSMKECEASDELLKFLIESMGYSANDENAILRSLERLEKRRWQRAMEAIYVRQIDNKNFDIVLKEEETQGDISVFLTKEGQSSFKKLNVKIEEQERRSEERNTYVKLLFHIEDEIEPGYYELKVCAGKNEYRTLFAVAPKMCYALPQQKKKFGFALQLYSMKSKRNWGVGDFTDLMTMVNLTADIGGDVIGLNPLNVLLNDHPEAASPYASISRLFLNPIYIDVEKVPFYQTSDKDEEAVLQAKMAENIDYTTVYNAKIKALRAIFERVLEQRNSAYFKDFEAFKKNDSGELNRLAVFQAIEHERFMQGEKFTPEDAKALSSALGSGVEKFAAEHKDDIEFFKFLQFEADRQLQMVAQEIKKRGLGIGLYRDLPVGVSRDSAEVWGDKYLYVQNFGAGAPPDNYFPTGQKWGLGAFNPFELKERGYKPFIRILRANMRYAGAVRIDHIMGMSRLFIIPDDRDEGTYIRYDAEDMMNILALESWLNKCIVVGECIGNVEDGYAESLLKRGIYLLGVLWCERKDANGTMKAPHEYESKYFASVGTHDMPPLKAWWFGREITTMQRLGFYTQQETEGAYHWREHERRLLLKSLDSEAVWPADKLRHGDYLYGENYPEGIEEAVHSYMAKTNSEVFMLMPEDIFQSEKIQNLPGTDIDQYPNWCAKQVVDIEDMAGSEALARNVAAVKKYR